ncbi:MAG: TSUP family transporter [Chitinophagaceae bacterium]|nr:TSUP family transporter [Chitinophagaceae bacterium]MCA6453388.1 TSUP family transporter [Chitinophagaceae bacterium]MCA6457743.1 TSUP family transporter [Chitinophagaceae bacterium]MCA6463456.1 TSUP family transporter [Chitinophagaceae bacterium]
MMQSIEQAGPIVSADGSGNPLFPVFLKLENLPVLLVGGGNVAYEKLRSLLGNAPNAGIRVVAIGISEQIRELAQQYPGVKLVQKSYAATDLEGAEIVVVAVNDIHLSECIRKDAKERNLLVNVADKPALCDFYLGSIVQKGNLKIAISTNGKSPTVAKRIKEVLNEIIPPEMDDVLNDMQQIRQQLNGDFTDKVKQLNDLTKVLVAKQVSLDEVSLKKQKEKKWQQIVKLCLFAFVCMILGAAVFSYFPAKELYGLVRSVPAYIDTSSFLMMLLTGFLAQMVDGSLGMGYGTISTTFLLANGVPPAVVSSRVHSARVFSSGVSGYSHHRFGNINKKLFRTLVVPGIIGAVTGATLAYIGQRYATYVRVPLAIYTCYLGYFIIKKAIRKKKRQDKVKRAGWLAGVGGFMDAFAGGGWGALVTSTLISKRKSPRYVIGSVCLAEFFVVFASAVTFFILLKHIPLGDVLGLIIGGILAAPVAARLVGKLPLKTMYFLVGGLVICTSLFTLWKAVNLLQH